MFAAIVLVTAPIWIMLLWFAVFHAADWLLTGKTPTERAEATRKARQRQADWKATGEKAIRDNYSRGGGR